MSRLGPAPLSPTPKPPLTVVRVPAPSPEVGWTPVTPSSDTRITHVSWSTGSDSGDGSASSPVKSLEEAYWRARNGYPDHVLLKRGDVWPMGFRNWDWSGRSRLEPMVVGAYGYGPMPVFRTGNDKGFACGLETKHLRVLDLDFASGYDGRTGSPVGFECSGGGGQVDVWVEGCRFVGYFTGVVAQWSNQFTMRRCVITDCWADIGVGNCAGAYFAGNNGLTLEENCWDHNGWREDAHRTIHRRNLYVQDNNTNVRLFGNISARSATSGAQLRSGGISENNLYLFNGGGGLIFAKSGRSTLDVVMDTFNDPQNPMGTGIYADGADGLTLEDFICTGRSVPASYMLYGVGIGHESKNVTVRRGIVHDWYYEGAAEAIALGIDETSEASVDGCQLSMPRGGVVIENKGALTCNGNGYAAAGVQPFIHKGNALTFGQWRADLPDPTSTMRPIPALHPVTKFEHLAASGIPSTYEGFLAEARENRKGNWRTQFTALGVNKIVRASYGR